MGLILPGQTEVVDGLILPGQTDVAGGLILPGETEAILFTPPPPADEFGRLALSAWRIDRGYNFRREK